MRWGKNTGSKEKLEGQQEFSAQKSVYNLAVNTEFLCCCCCCFVFVVFCFKDGDSSQLPSGMQISLRSTNHSVRGLRLNRLLLSVVGVPENVYSPL